MRRWMSAVFVAAAAALYSAGDARAEIVTIGAMKDNTLISGSTSASEAGTLSNGEGQHFFAGRTDNGFLRRGVIAFDIAGAVPQGSTITMVVLRLNMSRTRSQDETVTLRRALADWGEGASNAAGEEGAGAPAAPGDATWLHRFHPSSFWNAVGGDFSGTISASQTVRNNGPYTWTDGQMVADVQNWLDNPSTNYGWFMIGNEVTDKSVKRFDTREHPTAGVRPMLVIEFTPPASTGACCFFDGTCLVLDPTQCAADGGQYQGNGTSCNPNPCPQPAGACCLPDGTCDEMTLAACESAGGQYQGDFTGCETTECPLLPFVDALPIPAVAQPVTGQVGGEATYQIAMIEFQQKLHRDLPPTTLWGYNGMFPGPSIVATTGQPVTVEWINDLRDITTGELRTSHYLPVDPCPHGPGPGVAEPRVVVHLHGGVVPPEFDGYPESTFLPGQSATYVYPNIQRAGTIWYHDHALGTTRLNVMMGLAGAYVITDTEEQALGLPSGEFDVPLVIQDRTIDRVTGALVYPELIHDHFFGELILVNGKVWPYLDVKRGKYRFRMLGGSTSRSYVLALSNGATFQQIATDAGLMGAPVELTSLTISPGERAEIIIDFAAYSPGTEIILTNSAPAPFPGSPGVGVIPNVMKFIVGTEAGHTAPIPAALAEFTPMDPELAVQERDFVLRLMQGGHHDCADAIWLINDLLWDDITEFPVLGTTEIWRFINRSAIMHPMHMHLVHFQVLDRQAFDVVEGVVVPVGPVMAPEPSEIGWKDTVQARPNEIVRVIATFEPFTGLYPYHCHILEHEDHEMMRQFQVVAPMSCTADLSGDGQVGAADLALLLGAWGLAGGGTPADLNDDGQVNAGDLALMLGSWGPCR